MVLADAGVEGMGEEAQPSQSAAVLGGVDSRATVGEYQAGNLSAALQAIATVVFREAERSQGDGRSLLALLRLLESLHREIRDGLFQESLPASRQALYTLLKDMEAEGGWPYIHRMKLREVLANLLQEAAEDDNLSSKD